MARRVLVNADFIRENTPPLDAFLPDSALSGLAAVCSEPAFCGSDSGLSFFLDRHKAIMSTQVGELSGLEAADRDLDFASKC